MMNEYLHIDNDKGDVQFPGQVGRDNEGMMSSDAITLRNNNTTSLVSLRHVATAVSETRHSHRVVKATAYESEHIYGNTQTYAEDDINEEIFHFVSRMLPWSHEQVRHYRYSHVYTVAMVKQTGASIYVNTVCID